MIEGLFDHLFKFRAGWFWLKDKLGSRTDKLYFAHKVGSQMALSGIHGHQNAVGTCVDRNRLIKDPQTVSYQWRQTIIEFRFEFLSSFENILINGSLDWFWKSVFDMPKMDQSENERRFENRPAEEQTNLSISSLFI